MLSEVTGTELKGFSGDQALCETVSLQSVKCFNFKRGNSALWGWRRSHYREQFEVLR